MKIIHQDCEKSLSRNKSLPVNSYLVTYFSKNEEKHDIVQASTLVEVFDYYHDLYENVISIQWTDGKISPKMYGYTKPEKKKKP